MQWPIITTNCKNLVWPNEKNLGKFYKEFNSAMILAYICTFFRIFHMRNFNNWIKSTLINEYAMKIRQKKQRPHRSDREDGNKIDIYDPETSFNVLDIGCGKGGDLQKWSKARVNHFVGVDIAATSVEQAKERYHSRRNNFSANFFAADCTKADLETLHEDNRVTFDIVSCQFAFHYCFESLEQADCMLRNIAKRLRPGGFFIGTTTDANDIGKYENV